MIALAPRLLSTARAMPDATALVQGERRMAYAELADAACRFAGALRGCGVGTGDRVAIVLPNGIEAVVACYGTWLAGAIAVPLNPQARAHELGALLRHADPRLLVHGIDEEIAVALQELRHPLGTVVVGTYSRADALGWDDMLSAARPLRDACPVGGMSSIATILYTSGTTGAPKGVALTHANFAANVDAILGYLELSSRDVTVSVLPFHYAYGASVLHTHLAVGARVVIETNFVFPNAVAATLARERATGFSAVASMYALLLDRVPLGEHDLSCLRCLTHAGGPMSALLSSRLRTALPAARLVVMYGQTEATARLAWLPPERLDDKHGSAGRAIAGVDLQVRDRSGSAVSPGTIGEVWARGASVMAGYWNDPVATARVLHDGWLRTGDLGHLDDEGYLFLAGRRSDVIKTGAHRVHPLEVEEVLRTCPGVLDVVVVGAEDPLLGQVVKAVIVHGDGIVDAAAVRAHCRRQLAAHKVPRRVEFVDTLPRTATGKVRRAALRRARAAAVPA